MGAHIGGKGYVAEINVTPFVDVMLVLLIIFMVTAPMMTEGLDVDLPQTRQVEVLPTDAEHMILTVRRDGEIFLDEYKVQPDELEAHVNKLFARYAEAEKELVRYKTLNLDDAEIVFVAFGTMSRICAEAIEILQEKGVKAGLIRPISLWPFPNKAFDEISDKTKIVISTELSMGQMIEDVKMAAAGRWPVGLINRTGGIVPSSIEVAERALKALQEVK